MTALVSGGCIRLYATGPEWHTDTGHHTVGVIDTSEPPEIDASGFLVFRLIGGNPVVAMTAASDETLTAKGISAGCSNGGPICRVRFYKDGVGPLDLNNPIHWAYVAGKFNNVWMILVHAVPA